MNRANRATPTRVAQAVLAGATLLVAALLIVQCADIFITGTSSQNQTEAGVYIRDVYSRGVVIERLARISWAFVAWLVAWLGALVVRAVCRDQREASRSPSAETMLKLMRERVSATPAMSAQARKRTRAAIACAVLCAACAAPACVYLLRAEHFASRDLETVMGAMLRHVAPWILAAFAVLAAFSQMREKSVERELSLAKQAPKRNPEPRAATPAPRTNAYRLILYAAAVALLVAGVRNGGMYDVLVKAINICTECIGLG